MKKIESMSKERWAEIPNIRQKYIDNASAETDREQATLAVNEMYKLIGKEPPIVLFAGGPIEATLFYSAFSGKSPEEALQKINDSGFFCHWTGCYAAWAEGGILAGVKFDEKIYKTFHLIANNLSLFFPFDGLAIVCENPKIHWQDGLLHNETGPSVEYKDGFKLWTIGGVAVDEQIVMRPETQTLEQINDEENEEVKRVRITRYGWHKYLEEVKAAPVDVQVRDGWMESLMAGEGLNVLCTYDPSTGRPYALEVPQGCSTTEEAQRYLLAPKIIAGPLGLKASEINTYPVIRG